jgi:N-acetylglucosaminyl-diphospho-decaprenol L-rhamnosyltransferase
MRLTVSIVNYKTPQLVIECVASVKRFAPQGCDLDIAVVDNESGDNSLAIIGAAHPDIRLIDSGANRGFAGGNNLVLRDNTSDFVFLLNSDASIQANTIQILVDVLQNNLSLGAVGARVVNVSDGADQDYPFRFPSLSAMLQRALFGAQYPAVNKSEPIELERLHGAGILIPNRVLRSVGLLDEGFFMYDEDVDWCTRARSKGWVLALVPNARISHHGGASSERPPSGQRAWLESSETALRMRYELRKSRYRLYHLHRTKLESCALKLLTDCIVLTQSFRAASTWVIKPRLRPAAVAMIRSNLRILALNPFARSEPTTKAVFSRS